MIPTTSAGGTRFIRHGHACLGVAAPDGLTLTAGGHSDSTLWSRNTASPDGHLHAWSPWGAGDTTGGLPGFNGERPDPVSGSYHLGNGYRTYSPALRRFTCPDSLSPFGAGGINPYAYCAGDPVSRTDPTGHISWQGIVGIVGGIVGLGLSFIGGYMAIAAAEGIAAAVSSASATSLVVGGLGVAADVTAIASGATEDVNPAASSVLGWVSMATGIAGMISGAGAVGIRRMERAAAGAPWRTPEGRIGIEMSGRGVSAAAKHLATANMDELSAIAFQGHISEDKIFFLHNNPGRNDGYYLIKSTRGNEKIVPDGKYLFVNRTDEPERVRLALDSEVKGHTTVAQYINASGEYVPHNVYVAGELYFNKGVLSKWNVRSGHYLPDEEFFSRGPVNWLNNLMPIHLFDY
ncbi:RHS repeat-associated core domain-containing protein (plasmid) [Pantoea agglomerans]|uniref:RHS repeat-associated core domain-containing protein n=1 Tax=Enterobacter agglomerans TaxID=549 RepID=UPI002ED6337B|nr:RHS repeat-associated core domain-containing protein [Pantoea agglomerans]